MAGAGAPDLYQDLPRPGLGHRHFAEFGRLLPLDELECFHSWLPQFLIPIDVDQEVARAAEHRFRPVRRRIDDQPRVLHAAKKHLERGVHLQPRKRTAETDVDAAAPAEVLVVLAFGIEFVRVGELLRIAVCGAVQKKIGEPFGMIVPSISISARAVRVGRTGPTTGGAAPPRWRRESTPAGGAADRWIPGLRRKVSMQWAIRLTVES